MKRLCVYLMYDKEGIIDEYKMFMLRHLRFNAEKLIVIINGSVKSKYLLENIADSVFTRDNKGYDVGAYKELFMERFFSVTNYEWEEIILVNDSIIGPVCSLEEIFSHMDRINVDCWGLGRYEPDGVNHRYMQSGIVPEHLQSFFLAFRRSMVESECFEKYWREMSYPTNYDDAVTQAEFTQMKFIKSNGFSYTSWMDEMHCEQLLHTIAVYEHTLELVSEYRFPVIKRKFFLWGNYIEEANKTMEYLKENTDYDVRLIKDIVTRIGTDNVLFGKERLLEFVEAHEKKYIFGHGMWGNNTAYYLDNLGIRYEGFVVSSPDNSEDYCLSEIRIEERDGIIVALGERWLPEVKETLITKFGEKRLLFPKEE